MKKHGVLVVDDSALMRKSISAFIELHPDFYVIGKARNGRDALEKIELLHPALVTMDVEMPEMDGLQALQQMMKTAPVAVVVIANEAQHEKPALAYGAVDFILKKHLFEQQDIESFHTCLVQAVEMTLRQIVVAEEDIEEQLEERRSITCETELLIIGSSTGGPSALQKILMNMDENFPVPVFIVQHMPPGFTKSLAARFHNTCPITVKEAEHHELLKHGTAYIAPAGTQASIVRDEEGQLTVCLHDQTDVETLYHPSIDVALLSIAAQVNTGLVSVILTGMGDDGLRGCQEVKRYGGHVIVEAEKSCVVYGMPKVVAEAGLADVQVPIDEIFKAIWDALKV